MKTKFLILISFILTSCKHEDSQDIICNVNSPDGFELVYSVEGDDFQNRQIQTVKNGKVVFKFNNNTQEVGYIESLYNLDNYNYQRAFVKVLPESKTINVDFDIVKDSIEIDSEVYAPFYFFDNTRFDTDGVNKEFKTFEVKKFNYLKEIDYSYSKQDSLNKYVFPQIKEKLLNLYETRFKQSQNQRLKVEILNSMLNDLVFESNKHLSEKQISKINTFFNEITISPNNNNFHKLQKKINDINKIDTEKLTFVDFDFEDTDNQKHKLSKFIETNDYTVLYFWTAGCGPCRSFNKKLTSEYMTLKEKGIEIVHINVDLRRSYWKKATEQDSIFWKNLYAGKNLDLHKKYQIKWWPTKVIFNKNKELVNFDFINPKDLLDLEAKTIGNNGYK